jgi:peptidoglycan/xylan/chitin deacetylase (PgdA/CDA1 family)
MSRNILITLDVEEFDIPLEYNCAIPANRQMEVGKAGLDAVLSVIQPHNIACTMFTTANFANHYPHAVQQMAQQHEIASHTYYHSTYQTEHLLQSRLRLQQITGKPITGLRMPRMKKVPMADVVAAGYAYDSSVNPIWLPGRYNNLHLPRTTYTQEGMLRVPASVSPGLRIPLFWLAFKNMPYGLFKKLTLQTLRKDGYVCLYFHPWEFVDIEGYNLPGYVKKRNGQPLLHRLDKLIRDMKQEGDCISIQQMLA